MSWSIGGRELRSVLVSRLRYLGDVVMSTVVLEVLRRGDPGLELAFLCEAAHAPALRGQPCLREVHALAARRAGADARARRPEAAAGVAGVAAGTLATVRRLRARRYDAAVDLFFNPRSALLLRLAGSRWRLGGGRSWRRRLYTHVSEPPAAAERGAFRALAPGGLGDHLSRLAPLRHEPDGLPFLDWLERRWTGPPPGPRLAPPPPDATAAAALADRGVVAGRPYVVLAPGATWRDKEWPPERWADLAALLAADPGLPVVALSPPAGAERQAALRRPSGAGGGLLPPLPLAAALAAVAGAALTVAVDGGIAHASVGLGRPTLALFGPTEPAIWFPYERLGPFRVLRAAGTEPARMEGLAVGAVAAAARDLLRRAGAEARP